MCKQGHISSSPWLNEWGSSPGLETTWCLSRTSFGSMTMTGRAAMTGNVTRIRNPITPVVVKAKVRRQLSCLFFPAPVVFGQGGGGWWTTMCIKLCGSWMEIEFQDIIHFFVIFLKMYLVKWICLNVFVQIYLSKCISQNVFVKFICQNVFFSCLSISLIKCLKGQKCLGLLFNVKNQKWLSHSVSDQWVSEWVSQWVTRSPIELFVDS